VEQDKFQRIVNDLTDVRLNRRRLLKWGVAGMGLTTLPLLVACGSDDDDEPDEADGGTTPVAPAAGDATNTPGGSGSGETPAGETSAAETPAGEPAVTAGTDSGTGAAGGQVSVLWRTPNSLNPLFSTAGSEQQIERLIFGALVKMNHELGPVPDMAASIEVSDDASVYTFILHENVMFSDGQPLTAEDVIFTFERAIDERTGSYWLGRLNGIDGALPRHAGRVHRRDYPGRAGFRVPR
jgi:ABC-type transport system substrate-binding protein